MNDLISRQALTDAMYHEAFEKDSDMQKWDSGCWIRYKLFENVVKSLPSAQQEIVACGDCIHWICHDRRCGYWNHGVKPLDWCCHAERRTDD